MNWSQIEKAVIDILNGHVNRVDLSLPSNFANENVSVIVYKAGRVIRIDIKGSIKG